MNAGVGNIQWSNAERSGEMTKFMALTRWLRGGSPFYTVSPDPVHNIATIQWPAPLTRSRGHRIVYKLSALKGGGVLDELETRSKAYKHGQDRMMVHSIVLPH